MFKQIITTIVKPITDLLSEYIEDKDKRAELEGKIRLALLEHEQVLVSAARDVVVAEAKGESWLQRNWRPLIMLSFGAILVNNYILVPWLHAAGIERAPLLEMPDGLWTLLTVGLGGYVVGRTIEKTGSSVRIGGGIKKEQAAGGR